MMNKSKKPSEISSLINSSRGITVVSIIVTIVMIIIIASIAIFTGTNLLRQAREDRAKDRLNIIYQALRAYEPILGIGDTADVTSITNDMYKAIGLDYLAKDKDLPEVTYSKRIGSIDNLENELMRTYTLSDGTYTQNFEYDVSNITYSLAIDFDSFAGVNRPQLTDDMIPISYINSSEGEEVDDIYLTHWYSYDSSSPNYANMKLKTNNKYYVWIPRYAYRIQSFYEGASYPDIPQSAIDIIFLKSTTNLDANGNKIPSDYIVHPAFTYGDTELTGIWIEKEHNIIKNNSSNSNSIITTAYTSSLSMYNVEDIAESHMLKNTEWAAFAYLAQACGAAKSNVSSTGNNSGVKDINEENEIEYVSAYINNSMTVSTSIQNGLDETKNVYITPGNYSTLNSTNPSTRGDAIIETSSGEDDNSAWYGSISVQPRQNTPFIVRCTGDSVFGFSSANGKEKEAYYRTAIKVVGAMSYNQIIPGVDSKYVKVAGDVYLYEPSLTGFNPQCTFYVTWDEDGEETLTPITNPAPVGWYNYSEQKWANILVTANQNKAYFVWIPRYVYKLDSTTQTSDVRFVDINNKYEDTEGNISSLTIGSSEWRLPEAFNWEGRPIQGYWISKYQVSKFEGFSVARFSDKIQITLIDEKESKLGNGTYSYYIGNTLAGTAAYNATFTYTNLQPNTTYNLRIIGSNGAEISRSVQTIGSLPKVINTTSDQYFEAPVLTGFNLNKTYYVTWDKNGNEKLTPATGSAPYNWYDYTNRKWANIMVDDGNHNKSYLVWIPRYKYSLSTYGPEAPDFFDGDTKFGYSKVKFIKRTEGTAGVKDGDGYIVPQAFNWDGVEIPGFWITKYQVSIIDTLYVERGMDYIKVTSIGSHIAAVLGNSGNYTYYLNGTNKGSVEYNKAFTFSNLNDNTTYEIKIVGSNGESITRIVATLIKNNFVNLPDSTSSQHFEAPDLTGFDLSKTYYVTWDSNGVETLTPATSNPPSNWYDYTNKKWANVLVENGNNKAYFVWIPRYRYILETNQKSLLKAGDDYLDGLDSLAYQYSKVEFIKKDTGTAGTVENGYAIPQAFNWDGQEIAGFWISKYQVSAAQ